jgi:hypothetical protein
MFMSDYIMYFSVINCLIFIALCIIIIYCLFLVHCVFFVVICPHNTVQLGFNQLSSL